MSRLAKLAAVLFLFPTAILSTVGPASHQRVTWSILRSTSAPPHVGASAIEAYGQIPLHFEANEGQAADEVKFLTRGNGYAMFFTPTETVLSLTAPKADAGPASKERISAVVRMKLLNANSSPSMAGIGELAGKVNYFIGSDPTKWRTNVATYAKVKHENVYPGVDLIYYGNQQQLEYDFVVAPGADPRTIRLGD